MPTPTTHYGFQKPIIGADVDQWGQYLNDALDEIDQLLFERLSTSGGTVTGNVTVDGTVTADQFAGSGAGLTGVPNSALVNSSVTVAAGSGLSGGGAVSLGGIVTLNNADPGSSQNIFKRIADAAGTVQFSASNNNDIIRFAGSGSASVSFDPTTKTVTITAAAGGSGDVTGPASATPDAIVLFNGSTGKVIKNSGATLPAGSLVGTLATQDLYNKTLIDPGISSFQNATHNHTNAAGGGQLTDAALASAVSVSKGGTGQSSLFPANGVLLGNGTNPVSVTSAGSANQVFRVPAGGGAPSFGAIDVSQSATVTGTLSPANGGTGINTYNKGDLLAATGTSSLTRVSVGSNGQVLMADSSQAAGVRWADLPGAAAFTTVVNSNYTVSPSNGRVQAIFVDASPGTVTISLPDVTTVAGYVIHVKKIDGSPNAVILMPVNGQTIDFATSKSILTGLECLTIVAVAGASLWFII